MSNLGQYQVITVLSKKVGGPKVLGILTAVAGYLVFRPIEAGIKHVYKAISNKMQKNYPVYSVDSAGTDTQGLAFNIGDQFRVLEKDKNTILIEKIGDNNNPYYVDSEFLKKICSNFKAIDGNVSDK